MRLALRELRRRPSRFTVATVVLTVLTLLLLLTCGTYDNVVRFIPPLVITDDQIHAAVRIFRDGLLAE